MASFDSFQSSKDDQVKRRALIIGGTSADDLRQQLAESGYETAAATIGSFARAISDFAPDVALIVLETEVDVESDAIAVARRLREEPATHALPLILVCVEEERLMRSIALNVGVDDYFGIWTPHGQMLARLDALFWRIEAGRRAASMSGDKRLEIDNFMVLLEAIREDINDSASGTVGLIYAMASNDTVEGFNKQTRDRTLAEAHGFFKLNLRRIDAVGFYGPTTLLIYLPRIEAQEATTILMGLRDQFLAVRSDSDLAIGVSSFPGESSDVEVLIERAEASAAKARAIAATSSVNASLERRDVSETVPNVAPALQVREAAAPTDETPAQTDTYTRSRSLVDIVESPVVLESRSSQEVESRRPLGHKSISKSDMDVQRAAAEQAAARERERRKRGANVPRRLLLTVSDAARMAQLNALVRSAGYEARTAFDGQQALDLLRIERPDVLLLDYELRGIDGIEMLRRLRKQTNGKLTVPVVMLLPPMQVIARREALELGASGIVAMPYDPAELLDSVRLAGSSE